MGHYLNGILMILSYLILYIYVFIFYFVLVEDCKKRWRNIKDTYNRRKKKGKSTGSAAFPKQAKWALADMLSFLDQTEHKRL